MERSKKAKLRRRIARPGIKPLQPQSSQTCEQSALVIASACIDELTNENARLRREAALMYKLLQEQSHRAEHALRLQRAAIQNVRNRKVWGGIKRSYVLTPIEESKSTAMRLRPNGRTMDVR